MKRIALTIVLITLATAVAESQDWKSSYDSAKVALSEKNYATAFDFGAKAEQAARKAGDTNDVSYANILTLLFQANYLGNNFSNALVFARLDSAVRKRLQLKGENSKYVESLINLATIYSRTRQTQAAEDVFLEAIEIYESSEDRNEEHYATALNNLGLLYQEFGRLSDAEYYYRKALEIYDSMSGDNRALNAAFTRNNLGKILQETGRYEESIELFEQAEQVCLDVLNADHSYCVLFKNNLALSYFKLHEYDKAREYFEFTVDYYSDKGFNPDYLMALNNLGLLYMEGFSRPDSAAALFAEAERLIVENLGENYPVAPLVQKNLGLALLSEGKKNEAVEALARADSTSGRIFSKYHPDRFSADAALALGLAKSGEIDAADELLNRAMEEMIVFFRYVLPSVTPKERKTVTEDFWRIYSYLISAERIIGGSGDLLTTVLLAGDQSEKFDLYLSDEVIENLSGEAIKIHEALLVERAKFANLALSPKNQGVSEDSLETVLGKVYELEIALAGKSPEFKNVYEKLTSDFATLFGAKSGSIPTFYAGDDWEGNPTGVRVDEYAIVDLLGAGVEGDYLLDITEVLLEKLDEMSCIVVLLPISDGFNIDEEILNNVAGFTATFYPNILDAVDSE